jgi:hypothetical protein
VLNSAERKRHFDFPVAILRITAELRTSANQLCFPLSCGYFSPDISPILEKSSEAFWVTC